VEVFTEEQADAFSFDVLDATKLVPQELVPVRPIGRMVLNRNPDNFFAETEQVSYSTANVVPGIDFSNDPLLAGRSIRMSTSPWTRTLPSRTNPASSSMPSCCRTATRRPRR
jgi:catalase